VREEEVVRDQGFENFKKEVFSIFERHAQVADSTFLTRENAEEPEEGIQLETIVKDKNPKLQIFRGVFPKDLDEEIGITVGALRRKAAQVLRLGEKCGMKTEVFQTSNIPPTKKKQKNTRKAIGRQSVPLNILTKHKLNNPNSKNEDIKAEPYLMRNIFDYTRLRLSREHIPADAKFSTDGFVCLLSQKNQEIQAVHSDYQKHTVDTYAHLIPADDSDSQKSLLIATENHTFFWYLTETVPDILEFDKKSAAITKIKDGKDKLEAKAVTMMAGDVLIFDRDLLHAGDKYRADRASKTESEAARFFAYFGVGGQSKTPRVHGATAKEKTQGVSSFTAAPFFLPGPDVLSEGDEGVKIVFDESSLESFNESVQRSGALRKRKRKT
jgi:hypothetical protein